MTKQCGMCKTTKPLSEFYADTRVGRRPGSLMYRCKTCCSVLGHCWRRRNRSQWLATAKQYREANPEKVAAASSEWGKKNPDRVAAIAKRGRENNPDKYREWRKRWKQANPGKHCAHQMKRKAAQLCRTPAWADLDAIARVYEKAATLGFAVDHVIPLQGELVSGLHVWENLQLLSKEENSRKKNRFEVM